MTKTRFPALAVGKIGRDWSFYDISDGKEARVGPVYKTKMEALCDLDRYARDAGWLAAV